MGSRSVAITWQIVVTVAVVGALATATGTEASAAPVRGTVLDGDTLEGVANATVSNPAHGASVETGVNGEFALDLPPGSHSLAVSADGYQPVDHDTAVGPAGAVDVIVVVFKVGAASEVIVVQAFDTLSSEKSVAGHTEISRDELVQAAGTRGDALHGVRNLPGTANIDPFTPGEFAFGLVVRGSSPEDSNYMVNGIELPILYHFFGLQSILPSEMIEDIEYIPGGFDVQYGNSTGGIVNIHTRPGVSRDWSGFAELSFISASGFVEGPISREHDVWLSAGFRRSIIDALVPLAAPDELDFTTVPQYYDSQLRIDWTPAARHNLMLMAFTSWDFAGGDYGDENPVDPAATGSFDNRIGFTRTAVSYHFKDTGSEVFARTWLGNADYEFTQGDAIEQSGDGLIHGSVMGVRRRLRPWLQLRAGGEYQLEHYSGEGRFPLPPLEGQPGVPNATTDTPVVIDRDIDREFASVYAAADLAFGPVRLTPGVRYDNFISNDADTVSPRATVTCDLRDDLSVSGTVGRYTLQSRGVEILRSDLEPEESMHYVVGVEHKPTAGVEVTVTGFVKDLDNLIVADPDLVMDDPTEAWVNRGTGLSRGLETMLRVRRARWFGWLSYTLQKSERTDGPGMPERLFDYDQTHNLIVLGSYARGPWRFGGRFQFATGEPDTPITGSVYDSDIDAYRPVYGEVNSVRKARAHQLDARVERQWRFQHWRLSAYLDVSNVYAHARPIAKSYNFNYSQSEDVTTLPVFPALGLRGSF